MTATAAITQAAPAIRSEHKLQASRASKKSLRSFAKGVRRRREELCITFTELRTALGISKSQMSHIECGDNWPSMAVYVELCRVLKVGVPPLVGK